MHRDKTCSAQPKAATAAGWEPEYVKLQLGAASLTGIRRQEVTRFGALRYARPPVGALRFAPPVPAHLQGEIDATGTGPVAPQLVSQLAPVMGMCEAPQSEDCLHLTVWTPATGAKHRPVLVWCHGGAWQNGGVLDWYDGAGLARNGDVVVVAVSARVGPLGWLLAEGGMANLGLLDLKLAFNWIAEHIEGFGGDPERITAMGQSAGGVNLAALLMGSDPSFQRAILQSAPLGRKFRTADAALSIGKALLHAAGAADLQQARSLPVEKLLRAQLAPEVLAPVRAQEDGHGLYCPIMDGATVAAPTPFDSEAARRVDVLVGWNRDEMRAFTAPGAPASEDQTEQRFAAPARRWAAQAAQAGRQSWVYRFDGSPAMPLGACHCTELPFVFGTHEAFASAPMLGALNPVDRQRLTQEMQCTWLDFVHGKPLQWDQSPHVHVFA